MVDSFINVQEGIIVNWMQVVSSVLTNADSTITDLYFLGDFLSGFAVFHNDGVIANLNLRHIQYT